MKVVGSSSTPECVECFHSTLHEKDNRLCTGNHCMTYDKFCKCTFGFELEMIKAMGGENGIELS